jgi:hypothetical protein
MRLSPTRNRTSRSAISVLLAVGLLIALTAGAIAATPSKMGEGRALAPSQAPAAHLLIQNVGQFAPAARFLLKQGEQRIWLTDDALWLTVPDAAAASKPQAKGLRRQPASESASGTAIRFTFAGANPHPTLEPFGRLSTHVSYLIGNDRSRWYSDVPAWSGVRYHDLYPGIDLIVGDTEAGVVPWRLEARPGADLGAVALRAEGAGTLSARQGALLLGVNGGRQVSVAAPSWSLDGKRLQSEAALKATGADTLALLPGTRDTLAESASAPAAPAAGDLIYSMDIGGSVDDTGYAVAVDSTGSAYITGLTRSTDLPVTAGAYHPTNDGTDEMADAFVAKVDPLGSTLNYLTYMGGTGRDAGFGLAVDGGVAYVAGETTSQDFAGTSSDLLYTDIFVAALNPTGTGVNYLTRLSGTADDTASALALSGAQAYIVGTTFSADLSGATNCVADTGSNLLVAKLNQAGAPVYTTCVDGTANESGAAIAVRNDVAYATGDSTALDYTSSDMLVTTLDANGVASSPTLIGGSSYDFSSGIAVDPAGAVYLAGTTYSTDFPVTANTRPHGGGPDDSVVVVLAPAPALTIDFATYIGGDGDDEAAGIAIDSVQALYVTGTTTSTDFPTTAGAHQPTASGGNDLFVMRLHLLSSDPGKLTYSTYLGGAFDDYGFDVATDTGSNAFITGISGLGITVEQTDALLAKLKMSNPPDAPVVTIAASGADADLTWDAVAGATKYQVFASSVPYTLPGGSTAPLGEPTANSFPDGGALSQAGAHFYVVKAVNSLPAASLNSNAVGAFTFALVPGGN